MSSRDFGPPLVFDQAVEALERGNLRPEIQLEEVPAPKRIAPHAAAYAIRVLTPLADEPLATGRFVVLHDPAGHEAWGGSWRVVVFAQADLEPEVADDPLLAEVAWSWLKEILVERGIDTDQLGGTVTRVLSQGFDKLSDDPAAVSIELRASWSPADHRLGTHLGALGDLLGRMAGLPPVPTSVAALDARR